MRSAGEEEDVDGDGGGESTDTAAMAAVVDAAALMLGDCPWPPASGAAA